MKIKEASCWTVCDSKDNILKSGFKDPFDALEFAVNHLLKTGEKKVVLRGEIVLTAK